LDMVEEHRNFSGCNLSIKYMSFLNAALGIMFSYQYTIRISVAEGTNSWSMITFVCHPLSEA
jgi:hypothetical protein